jgi:hypothetical protein
MQRLSANAITFHRGAFCQFPFRWIYYYCSYKSTGKLHLYYTKSRNAFVGKTSKIADLPSTTLLEVRLVLLSKTISSTIEAIFLGSQVPEGYTKTKQVAALLTCAIDQQSSVAGYPPYQLHGCSKTPTHRDENWSTVLHF